MENSNPIELFTQINKYFNDLARDEGGTDTGQLAVKIADVAMAASEGKSWAILRILRVLANIDVRPNPSIDDVLNRLALGDIEGC
jgi:hypothetical protein